MSDEWAIEIQGLTKYFGRRKVVDGLDLRVRRGAIYGFLGRNGAGKTTTIKMILGLLRPTRGSVSVLGFDSQALPAPAKARIGYVSEGHPLYGWMSVERVGRFVAAYYPTWDWPRFREQLDQFGLPPKQRVKALSRGQRAQLSLALALAPDPELLVMDDPTMGLDPAVRKSFLESMVRFIQAKKRTILLSSHILSDVERVADRIAILHEGVLLADCPIAAFRRRVKEIRAAFDDAPPALHLPRVVNQRRVGDDLLLTVVDYDEEHEAALKESGAAEIEILESSLEDLFIEYTNRSPRPNGAGCACL